MRLVVLLIWIFASTLVATAQQGAAPRVSKAAQDFLAQRVAEACDGNPGSISWESAVVERDLTGDGQPDLVVDHHLISCSVIRKSRFCVGHACPIHIYVRRGANFTLKGEVLAHGGFGFKVGEERLPAVQARSHGGTVVRLRWNGHAFADVSLSEGAPCVDEHNARSLGGTGPTAVTFANKSASAVRTYWVDGKGVRKLYAEIPPGGSYVQQTYVNHPWVVTNSRNDCLGVFRAASSESSVVVTEPWHQLALAHRHFNQGRAKEAARSVTDALPELELLATADFKNASGHMEHLFKRMEAIEERYAAAADAKDFARFAKVLALTAASYATFATDAAGAAVYLVRLLDLKLLDPPLFMEALEVVARNAAPNCQPGDPGAACVADISAGIMRGLGAYAASLEFNEVRLDILKKANSSGSLVSKTLLAVAGAELERGLPAKAAIQVAEIKEAELSGPELARKFGLEAALAFLRLDDDAAAGLMAKARTADPAGPAIADIAYAPAPKPCRECDLAALKNARETIRTWLGTKAPFPSTDSTGVDPTLQAFLEMARLSRQGLLEAAEFDAIAASIIGHSLWITDWVERTKLRASPKVSRASLLEVLTLARHHDAPGGDDVAMVDFFLETDLERMRAKGTPLVQEIYTSNFGQFGLEVAFFRAMSAQSKRMATAGFEMTSQVILELMLEVGFPAGNEQAREYYERLRLELADVVVEAHASLAAWQVARGDLKSAQAHLDNASGIAKAVLARDRGIGSDQLMQSLRRIAPSLSRAAEARIDLMLKDRSLMSPAGPAAFAALQLAGLSELALASHSATKRRVEEALKDPGVLTRRDEVQQQLHHLKGLRQLDVLRRNAQLTQLIGETESQLASLNRQIEAALPDAGLLTEIDTVTVEDVRKSLAPAETFIQLHAGEKAVHGVAIERIGPPVFWRADISIAELEAAIREVRNGADTSTGYYAEFPVRKAHQLYRTLFGGVADRLRTSKRLTIVGDGPLTSLPFAALVTEPPKSSPQRPDQFRAAQIDWLIRRSAIAGISSARTFVQQRTASTMRQPDDPFAGIGNPILAPGDASKRSKVALGPMKSRGLADVALLRALASLPETEDELRTIAAGFGASGALLLLGADATETKVKAADLARYRIIAFATHGLVAGEADGAAEPGLVLTPPAVASRQDDGLLTASEILGLKLNADLVILSACNTAASDGRPRAEGLSGLAKAFFAAGARGLLVTHLPIPSVPAVAVTTGMIEIRARDRSLDWAQALQRSVVRLMDEHEKLDYAHPANWAPYAVLGATLVQ